MSQTKLESFLESMTNIAIGYFVGVTSQMIIFPVFGIHISASSNFLITAWFTAISLVRSYIIRRWFNGRVRAAAHRASMILEGASNE